MCVVTHATAQVWKSEADLWEPVLGSYPWVLRLELSKYLNSLSHLNAVSPQNLLLRVSIHFCC